MCAEISRHSAGQFASLRSMPARRLHGIFWPYNKQEARMTNDPIRGKTLRFTFTDGPMAHKTFEHVFREDGLVSFHMVGDAHAVDEKLEKAPDTKYEAAIVRDDIC